MFELTIEDVFSAAHAIAIEGVREHLHGHDWRVTAAIQGDRLDDDGLLCDFHAVQTALNDSIAPFRHANLNDTPPFDNAPPTAELVALHIAQQLTARLADALANNNARVAWVRVTESPGCAAAWHAD